MKAIKRLFRLLYISYVLLKHGLDEIVLATHLFRPMRFLIRLSPRRWLFKNEASRGERIRRAAEELGPIFVKFGQLMSTRVDLLPDDIAQELVKLQDKVVPFPGETSKALIEEALDLTLEEAFESFSITPLASASISQVHAAKLHNGKEVVVKVLRPDVHKQILADIELMESIAKLAEEYWKESRRLRPLEVVREFKKTILDELDLMREAANASQLRRNFQHSHLLYVPEIYWPLTRKSVLVMERIYGIQISNVAELKRQGTDLKRLAEMGVEVFFTQVFRDCFFHADMHPGNIWVDITNPSHPRYIGLDFGIMGTLGPADQRYLAENFLAFFKRNYRRVAELHVESGWVPADTRVDEFESAIRCVCEPIFERPLKDISFGHTLMRLFQVARRFNMSVQPQLVLLQKTLISIEGLGRQLYPDLDLWHTAKPFLEQWMKSRIGAKGLFSRIKNDGPFWLEKLPDLPEQILHWLETKPQLQATPMRMATRPTRSKFGFGFCIGIASMIIGTTTVFTLKPDWLAQILDKPTYSTLIGMSSALIMILIALGVQHLQDTR